jgi:oligopeptide transport system substrate-binding protein
MKAKKILIVLVVIALAISLAACGGSKGDLDMNVCVASEPQTIDPQLNSAVDGAIMLSHMFEGLMKWADDGKGNATLVTGQAASYTVSDDGLVYTFTLRDDIKWSDGQTVKASDFVYAWQRLVNPATAADYNYMIEMVQNASEIMAGTADPSTLGIVALDDKTIQITLVAPTSYFLEVCAFPACFPVRQDIIAAYGDQWTFSVDTYIGNGSYKMSEWVHNSYIKMVPSETYYDYANLGPTSITFQLMDDENAIYAAFQSGQLDFIENVPVDEIAGLLKSGDLKVDPYIGTYYVCFNTTRTPFDDARVRKAFSLVIDRNYIVENITQTGQVPAAGYVPSGINDVGGASEDDFRTNGGDYYSVNEKDYEDNCDEARALLAEAGYPNGEGFPIVEYIYNTSGTHKAIAEALQNMWQEELGVTVTLSNSDWAVFLQTRKDGDYSIARNAWIADYNDPTSFLDMWVTGGGNNDAQYSNAEYDALISDSKTTLDTAQKYQDLHDAEDILMEDSVVAPIYFYTNMYMMNKKIEGKYYSPLGYYFFNYCTYK